jgi:hypothetical protein
MSPAHPESEIGKAQRKMFVLLGLLATADEECGVDEHDPDTGTCIGRSNPCVFDDLYMHARKVAVERLGFTESEVEKASGEW